jgi:hypothetical protein
VDACMPQCRSEDSDGIDILRSPLRAKLTP